MRNTTPHRSLPSIALLGTGLALSVCWGTVGAQGLSMRTAEWTSAALNPRGDAAVAATTLEVGTARGRLSAPTTPPPGLDGRAGRDLAGVSYRVWMSRGRADIGIGLGSLGFVVAPVAGGVNGVTTLVGALPTMTVGVRYRLTDQHLLFADASRARGLGADPAGDVVSTQVGLEWRPARSTLGFEQGALGMQLDSGYHLSLKARRGGPALYLRGRF
jgi:hypothetical protein